MLERRGPRPWLAAVLSVLQAGLGHVYAGATRAGIVAWLAATVAGIAALVIASRLSGLVSVGLLVVVTIAVWVALSVHAWRVARRADRSPRSATSKRVVAALVFLVAATIAGAVVRRTVNRHLVEAYRIPSGAMEPTILLGDYLLIVPRDGRTLRPGALVVYKQGGASYLKRAVALPGDTIEMRQGRLLRDGRLIAEPYVQNDWREDHADSSFAWQSRFLADQSSRRGYHPTRDSWGPLVMPPRGVFVLGDNRHNSADSRFTGLVDVDSVIGRPTEVYFSWSAESSAVRWDRLGRPLQ